MGVKSINSISSLNITFAKFIVLRSSGKRLRIYYKLSSLLSNKFSLMDALERLWNIEADDGKKPNEPTAIAISSWMYSLERGYSFADALDGWAPMRERLMLLVGDVSKLSIALTNVIKVSEGTKKIMEPLVSALGYPIFLLFLTFVIIVMVGLYLVPPMTEFVDGAKWTGTAGSLVSLSTFIEKYWTLIPIFIIGAITAIALSMPTLIGMFRKYLDKLPPWSLYRMFTGVSWLMSLSALVKAGTPTAKALQLLRKNSTPYLRERIDKTIAYMNNGYNFGVSLKKTGLGFPDPEIVGDLCIYSELENFEEVLDKLANEYLEESIHKIKAQAAILNSAALLLISGIIAWVLLGTMDMQNQIQNVI